MISDVTGGILRVVEINSCHVTVNSSTSRSRSTDWSQKRRRLKTSKVKESLESFVEKIGAVVGNFGRGTLWSFTFSFSACFPFSSTLVWNYCGPWYTIWVHVYWMFKFNRGLFEWYTHLNRSCLSCYQAFVHMTFDRISVVIWSELVDKMPCNWLVILISY